MGIGVKLGRKEEVRKGAGKGQELYAEGAETQRSRRKTETAKRDSSLHRPTRSQEANGKGNGVGLLRSE